MKHITILAALLIITITGTQAQSLDNILEKHFEAAGQKKMAQIQTYEIKANVAMMGMEMPMEMKIKKPKKFRIDMEMMGQKTVQAFDGEKGWMINPMVGAGVQDLEGDQLKQAMSQTDMEGELFNYKAKGHSAELIGKVNDDGKETYRIKFTDKDGQVKNYFINADTYLVSKVKAKVEAMGQTMDVETKMLEYQDFDGIKMPKKIEVTMPMGTQSITFDEIKLNEKIDDAIFAKPAQ